jgi:hypothetical protein
MFQKLLFILILFNLGLLAQNNSGPYPNREGGIGNTQNPNSSQPKPNEKESNYTKSIQENIGIVEKQIALKLTDVERLQLEATEFNKELQKEIFLINESSSSPTGPDGLIIAKYVEFVFEAGKTKEIKIVNRKKLLKNDLHSITRTLTYTPGNSESIKITVERFDSKVKGLTENEMYKDLVKESKLQALKAIDHALFATIFRLDSFIQRSQISKIEKNRTQLEGL